MNAATAPLNPRRPTPHLSPCLLLSLMLFSTAGFAGPWSFAVTGDGRTSTSHLAPDPTGINTSALKKILRNITAKKIGLVLYTGDLVNGNNIVLSAKIANQLSAWTNLVQSEAPGLLILPVRGNHETYGDPEGALWRSMFQPGLDALPVAYLPGEEGFSYAYSPPVHPGTVFIALDQYVSGHLHRVNLDGLEKALQRAKAGGARHVFVFSHEMAFTCTSHPDSDNMGAFPAERDRFLDLLQNYGCEYFFAGHDHTYDWMTIRHPRWPATYALNQIVAGTAGAPFYADKKYFGDHCGYELTRLAHEQNTYGYLLVEVNDEAPAGAPQVRVTFEKVNL